MGAQTGRASGSLARDVGVCTLGWPFRALRLPPGPATCTQQYGFTSYPHPAGSEHVTVNTKQEEKPHSVQHLDPSGNLFPLDKKGVVFKGTPRNLILVRCSRSGGAAGGRFGGSLGFFGAAAGMNSPDFDDLDSLVHPGLDAAPAVPMVTLNS